MDNEDLFSPVLTIDPNYWQDMVDFNWEGVKIAKDDFHNAQVNLVRKKKLIKGHEISEKDYQNYLNTYYKIMNIYQQAHYSLAQSKEFLKGCFFKAPFECIVDQVLQPSGMAAGQPPTIVISQLNPIGIKIKMSRNSANKQNSLMGVPAQAIFSDSQGKYIFHRKDIC